MNPSTAEIVAAIEATAAREAIVLPNNPNVILAAEEAAQRASTKVVRVVPTRSLPAGLAALVAYDGARSADENAAEMDEAIAAVATGAVTVASRDVSLNGGTVRQGSYLGLLEDEPVAGGERFDEVAEEVVERLLATHAPARSVLTLLTGDEVPELNGLLDRVRERHPDLEVEVQEGGQPHYQLLLSAE